MSNDSLLQDNTPLFLYGKYRPFLKNGIIESGVLIN